MTKTRTVSIVVALTMLVLLVFSVSTTKTNAADRTSIEAVMARNAARLMPTVPKIDFSVWRTGPLDVAKVFGRSPGCENADNDLIVAISNAANRAGIPPRLLAATVAVESSCNPYAVSTRGAIGLTQVVPKVWKSKYDFAGHVNLLNADDNLRVGASILADNVQRFGTRDGLQRYLGTGTDDGNITPGGYAAKILTLAGDR
jgi:hypothetical protein